MFETDEVRILTQMVNHNQERRVTLSSWQTLNKVHGDLVPDLKGKWNRLEKTHRGGSKSFVALAGVTLGHIFSDI